MAGSVAALLAVAGLAAGGLPLYAAQRYQAEPMREAIELIRSTSTPDRAGVLFDRVDTYERLAAYLPGWSTLAALQIGGAADTWNDAHLGAFATERPELWYVIDFGAESFRQAGNAIDQRLSDSLCLANRQFAGTAQVAHYVNASPTTDLSLSAQFDNGIQLDRAKISGTSIEAGEPLCVELEWSATTTPSTDYTVFVHLLDSNNQVVAQSDLRPGGGYVPTTTWIPRQPIVDRHGLAVPSALPPGTYQVTIGLYAPDGIRLKVNQQADAVSLAVVEIRK
jgi:hypothetical protein